MVKRFVASLMIALFLLSAVSCAKPAERTFNPFLPDEPEEFDGTLHFNYDGTFKILFLSDFHSDTWLDDKWPKVKTLNLINLMLDIEDPDLVIFGGDTSVDETFDEHKSTLDTVLSVVSAKKIPWCHVFGNHDREGGIDPEELYNYYFNYDYCVSSDVKELDGTGTYYIPVYGYDSDELKYVVWCMDSHDYADEGYYDCVHTDQVEWYKKTSSELEARNGHKINGMMFCHMPVIELRRVVDDPIGTNFYGTAMESEYGIYSSICCSELNYGHFDAVKERGDVQLMLFGHDHYNNFTASIDGVQMGYVGSLCAFGGNPVRGTRVVVINENNTAHPETYFAFAEDQYYKFYMDFD